MCYQRDVFINSRLCTKPNCFSLQLQALFINISACWRTKHFMFSFILFDMADSACTTQASKTSSMKVMDKIPALKLVTAFFPFISPFRNTTAVKKNMATFVTIFFFGTMYIITLKVTGCDNKHLHVKLVKTVLRETFGMLCV